MHGTLSLKKIAVKLYTMQSVLSTEVNPYNARYRGLCGGVVNFYGIGRGRKYG